MNSPRNALWTLSIASTSVAVAALAGCGGGVFPNDQQHEVAAVRNIYQRVAFDLGCKEPQIVRLGDVARLGGQMTRMNFGATCGDKKASYVVTCVSNWGNITCTPEVNVATR